MDPGASVAEFKQAATRGTDWKKLVDVKSPSRFYTLNFASERGRRPDQRYEREKVENGVTNGQFTDGFVFVYQFTADEAYDVYFDANGTLTEVQDVMTASDLLKGKAFHN